VLSVDQDFAFSSPKPSRETIIGRTAKSKPGYIMKKLHERVSIELKLNRIIFVEFDMNLARWQVNALLVRALAPLVAYSRL